MMNEEDTDSDATTCDSDWANDEEVHVVLDTYDDGDTNSIPCSPSTKKTNRSGYIDLAHSDEDEGKDTGNGADAGNDGSSRQFALAVFNPPPPPSTASPGRNIPGKKELDSSASFSAYRSEGLDIGFDDVTFHRPKFSYSPGGRKRPLLLSPSGISPRIEIPALLNQYLRPYQQDGVRFLYQQFRSHSGAVLCDDMGLGKTIQAIAFMVAVLGKKGDKSDVLLAGPKQDKKMDALDKAKRKKVEVVLTTHETARIHVDALNSVEWLAVVCDEVHTIKSPLAQVTIAMNSLREKRRIGLTGTALQNNLSELWSILNWANPGFIGSSSDFHVEFERPILEGQKYNCTKSQLALGRLRLSELKELMKRCVLRRTKALISSELPQKEEMVVFCPISELQEQLYQEILDTEDAQLVLHADEICDCGSGKRRGRCCYMKNEEGVSWEKLGFPYSTLLNKCANHLGLLLPSSTTSLGQREKATEVCERVFSKHPAFLKLSRQASFLTLSEVQYCGKMQVIERLLSKFSAEKSKVIIFSNSVILLNIMENYSVSQGYTYCRLDGSTKVDERVDIVSTFNTDPSQFIFLISKKCGSVGLNIVGANRVIIYDPSWNPATDLQAEDRAFRIGQSRDVRVYRLITEGTVEEMIYLRQVYKQQLANMAMEGSKERRYFQAVAGDRKQKGELFGFKNLWPLRKPGQPGLNLTMDILMRADYLEAGIKTAKDVLHDGDLTSGEGTARQVRDTESSIIPGITTIAHSGGKSVVENSSVEEHISKEALTHVYGPHHQHSQDPANLVSEKLDVSDESDDVDSIIHHEDKGKCSPSSLQLLQPPSPSLQQRNKEVKIANEEVKITKQKDTKSKTTCARRGKSRRVQSSITRRKNVSKGLQFEELSPPSPKRDHRVNEEIIGHSDSNIHADRPKSDKFSSNNEFQTLGGRNVSCQDGAKNSTKAEEIQPLYGLQGQNSLDIQYGKSTLTQEMVDELFGEEWSTLQDYNVPVSMLSATGNACGGVDASSDIPVSMLTTTSVDTHSGPDASVSMLTTTGSDTHSCGDASMSMLTTTTISACATSVSMLSRGSGVVPASHVQTVSSITQPISSTTPKSATVKSFDIDELFGF